MQGGFVMKEMNCLLSSNDKTDRTKEIINYYNDKLNIKLIHNEQQLVLPMP